MWLIELCVHLIVLLKHVELAMVYVCIFLVLLVCKCMYPCLRARHGLPMCGLWGQVTTNQ